MFLLMAAALAADSQEADKLVVRAREALARGDTAEAAQLMVELLEFFPDSDAARRALDASLGSAAGGAPKPATLPPEDEAQASALLQEATEAVSAGDTATAKVRLEELNSRFPESRANRTASRLSRELAVVGEVAPAMMVERWYQGAATIPSRGAVLIVFWEAWCPHCNHEAEHIQQLATTFAGRLQVVGLTKVTKTSSDERVQQFITEHGWTFPVGKERDGMMSTAFAVTGIPAAAVVQDGVVIWRGHPARLTDELVGALLD